MVDRRAADLPVRALTPADSAAPIRACAGHRVTGALPGRLAERGVRVTGRPGYLRIAPSVYNARDGVETAMTELASALA